MQPARPLQEGTYRGSAVTRTVISRAHWIERQIDHDTSNPARGVAYGVAGGLAVWILVLLAVYLL